MPASQPSPYTGRGAAGSRLGTEADLDLPHGCTVPAKAKLVSKPARIQMDNLALARVLHVITVVVWIGGLSIVTTALLPAIRRSELGADWLGASQGRAPFRVAGADRDPAGWGERSLQD